MINPGQKCYLARQLPGNTVDGPLFPGTEVLISNEPFTQHNVETNRVQVIYHKPGATVPQVWDDFNLGWLRIDAPTSIDKRSKPVWTSEYPLLLTVCINFHYILCRLTDLLRSCLTFQYISCVLISSFLTIFWLCLRQNNLRMDNPRSTYQYHH